jgi:hypothetical protein
VVRILCFCVSPLPPTTISRPWTVHYTIELTFHISEVGRELSQSFTFRSEVIGPHSQSHSTVKALNILGFEKFIWRNKRFLPEVRVPSDGSQNSKRLQAFAQSKEKKCKMTAEENVGILPKKTFYLQQYVNTWNRTHWANGARRTSISSNRHTASNSLPLLMMLFERTVAPAKSTMSARSLHAFW